MKINFFSLLILLTFFLIQLSFGDAIVDQIFEVDQPDGSIISVVMTGDEFYSYTQSLDGYTLVLGADKFYKYARLSEDGTHYVSTGVNYSQPMPLNSIQQYMDSEITIDGDILQKYIRVDSKVASEQAARARELMNEERFQSAVNGIASSNSIQVAPVTGDVLGLTILVDFSDEVATIDRAEVDRYLNQPGYSEFGNNGSVNDYFSEVSIGQLNYTNRVTSYYRATHTKSHYNELNRGIRARELLTEALIHLRDVEGLDFSQFDANGDGVIDAINIFYAGTRASNTSSGLWPHSWNLTPVFTANGVTSGQYQITDMTSSLSLRTFCHENGHMVMGWPDLYDDDYTSNGIGHFGLMGYGGNSKNPVYPNPYLRHLTGWITPIEVTNQTNELVTLRANNSDDIYYYENPNFSSERYYWEVKNQIGRSTNQRGEGLVVWHIDASQNTNNNEEGTYGRHYKVAVVQADNDRALENNTSYGGPDDFYFAGNNNEFSMTAEPKAHWWNGNPSALVISEISELSEETSEMTMSISNGARARKLQTNIYNNSLEYLLDGSRLERRESIIAYNTGHEATTISDIQFSDESFIYVSPQSLPVIVAPGGRFVITVDYTGDDSRLFTGTMSVISDASQSPVLDVDIIVNGGPGANNMVSNGDFSDGGTDWILTNFASGYSTVFYGNDAADISIHNPGSATWNNQFSQLNLALEFGKTYTFSFDAQSNGNKTIHAQLETDGSPWTNYGNIPASHITPTMENYSYTFTMTETDLNARIVFNIGLSSLDIRIDNVSLIEVVETPVLTRIEVTPSFATITLEETVQLSAQGFDQYGEPYAISPGWDGRGAGTVMNGLFDPVQTGIVDVICSAEGVSAIATINVIAIPVLTRIEITPSSVSIAIGETIQLSAQGFDQFGIPLEIVPSWGVTGNGGTINNTGLFSATTVSTSTSIRAFVGGVEASVPVTVRDIQNENEMVLNGDFSSGGDSWNLANYSGGFSTVSYGNETADITITNPGSAVWNNQFTQINFALESGKTYTFSFDAQAEGNKQITAHLETNGSPWTNYGRIPASQITTTMKNFSYTFTMTETDMNARIVFNIGLSPFDIRIDNVSLFEVVATPVLDRVEITPGHSTIVFGETIQLTAHGFDQFGNPFAITPSWSTSGAGSVIDGLYEPYSTGTHAVFCRVEGETIVTVITVVEPGTNMIQNGDFSNALSFWELENYSGAQSNASVNSGEATIAISNGGSAIWNVQFRQLHIALEYGKRYQFSFDAKSVTNKSVSIQFETDGSPWTNYGNIPATSLTSTMQNYSHTFIMNQTDMNARLVMNIGLNNNDVTVGNIVLVEVP